MANDFTASEPAAAFDQTVRAMLRPEFYPHPVTAIEHVQTHISHVLLTGPYAYKVKKPVDFGFLDFSRLELRRRFCHEELRLNRRLAPEIYLAVWAVVRTGDGLALAPDREPDADVVEYCLQMIQMDRERQMDRLLAAGGVERADVQGLAGVLAEFYQNAASGPEVEFFGRPEQVRINVEENFRQTEAFQDVSVAAGRWRAIRDYALAFLANERARLEQRVAEGRVREGHGDLHAANVNLPPGGRAIIFDCIEFNQRFRCQDAAADLAFLAMDLDFHGREDLSASLVEAYVEASGDRGLAGVLDFYKCYRAVVRAKIHGFSFDDSGQDGAYRFHDIHKARAYWRLAARYAGGGPPHFLVLVMGLMGVGKTHLAGQLMRATGWLGVNSDAVRKQLHGLAQDQRSYEAWGQGLYGAGASQATYQELWEIAQARLAMGASVVVDASFRERAWRRRFADLARAEGAGLLLVEVAAAPEVVAARLRAREASGRAVSDGRVELMAAQAAAWQPAEAGEREHWLTVDGGAEPTGKLGPVLARLESLGWKGGD
ncbi:MAG: AAA family ATPase [Thermodesulfobacteriota bacterium]